MDSTIHRFFAPCPRGLEEVLQQELHDLGISTIQRTDGGVAFQAPLSAMYRVNLESRIASRVLWQVGHRPYRSESDVYDAAYALPWPDWFAPTCTIKVKVSAKRCPLRSLDFITLRIKDAICDKFARLKRKRPNVETRQPDLRIDAFLDERAVTLYLDTSGEPLFKRGYRKATVEAPLRENLAAGLLRLAQWDPPVTLLDPFCGGGSILVEAGLMAAHKAPGSGRRFAFERLSNYDESTWTALRAEAKARELLPSDIMMIGVEKNRQVLEATRANLRAARLESVIQLHEADALTIDRPADSGVIVSNPPYGLRSSPGQDLGPFYREVGTWLKHRFYDWRVWLFSGDRGLPSKLGLKPSRRVPLYNGSIECRLFGFTMVQGSHRCPEPQEEAEVQS
jgi:putative N6-adenine-specific DNA methylase